MSLPNRFEFTCPREMLFDDNGLLLRYCATRNERGAFVVSIPGNKAHPTGSSVTYAGATVERFIREGGWIIEGRKETIDLKALAGVCIIMGAYLGFLVWVMIP